jgi:hypothetical protein
MHTRGVQKETELFKQRAPTNTESALRLLNAPSVRFWKQTAICPVSVWALVVELHLLNWARAQAVRRISDKEEFQENAIRELRVITESAFQEAFQLWKKRWELCIASRGDYFEGDSALKCCKMSTNVFIVKVRSFFEHVLYSRTCQFYGIPFTFTISLIQLMATGKSRHINSSPLNLNIKTVNSDYNNTPFNTFSHRRRLEFFINTAESIYNVIQMQSIGR